MVLPRFIGITDLRKNVRRVFDRVAKSGKPIVVIRESKPEAVILPYKDFESFLQNQEGSGVPSATPPPSTPKP